MGFTRLTDIMVATTAPELRQKRGPAYTILDFGQVRMTERLRERGLPGWQIETMLADAVEQYQAGQSACESPIERMVLAGLVTSDWRCEGETFPKVVRRDAEARPASEVVIIPQFMFVRTRLDFAISVRRGDDHRFWAVECDGEAFHQDATAYRKRDDFLNSWGIQVHHMTGRQIHAAVHDALSPIVHTVNAWRASVE